MEIMIGRTSGARLIKRIFIVSVLFISGLMGACHGGTPTNYDTLTPDVQGSFNNAQVLKVSGTPPYAGCPTPAGQIDNRLQPGMVFQTLYEAINGDKPKKILTVNARILTVTADTLTEQLTPVSSAGLPPAAFSASTSLTCTTTGTSPGCQPPPFVVVMAPATNGQYSNCVLDPNDGVPVTPEVYSGKYQLASGQTFNAYETESDYQGVIVCDGLTMGEGTQTTTTVVSPEVPAEGAISSCGGTVLFSMVSIKNIYGRVVFGNFQERLSVP